MAHSAYVQPFHISFCAAMKSLVGLGSAELHEHIALATSRSSTRTAASRTSALVRLVIDLRRLICLPEMYANQYASQSSHVSLHQPSKLARKVLQRMSLATRTMCYRLHGPLHKHHLRLLRSRLAFHQRKISHPSLYQASRC